ncbi:hypothetical protein PENTCL1PPCAC_3410, partial [Pristionchus entomophagus]
LLLSSSPHSCPPPLTANGRLLLRSAPPPPSGSGSRHRQCPRAMLASRAAAASLLARRADKTLASSFASSAAMPSSSSLQGKDSPALKNGDAEPAPLAAGVARLFTMRFCPFAQRVAIYLAKKGIRTEIANVNLMAKPEWYFAKNPKGTVPTFELDGKVVFESLIVTEYLDGVFPFSSILPADDPYTRARQRILVEQLSVIVGGYTGIFFALKGGKTDAEIRDAIGKCIAALDECEKLAANNAPFFAGAAPGFPDYMIFPFFDRLWAMVTGVLPALRPALADDVKQFTVADFPGSAGWPRLTRWFDAAQRLEEVEASRQPHATQVAFLKTYVAGAPDYDIDV